MSRKTEGRGRELHDDLVMIGEVSRPHGIRGEIKIYLYSEKPENFKQYKEIYLQEPANSGTDIYKVVKSREQGKFAILKLANVETREAAEDLQGSKVWVNKIDFPPIGPDEYYWHQLSGLIVVTETGQEIGRVSRLFNTVAHDIMVVTGGGQEFLVPLKGGIIKDIDEQGGKIIISPPPGLLEINK